MKHIIRSVEITRKFTRYGGDHYCTLSLVVTNKMVCYLWFDSGSKVVVQSITSHPEYIDWLFHYNEGLLDLERIYWWNDRTNGAYRYDEFHALLDYNILKE